ncbi:MAG: SGNH/GDSL hydrolase family protein [Clostridia bacterium]|nr:SGNH/GDSL hydrolase family protein [Clostridia bacterium]
MKKTILFQGDSITDCGRIRELPTNIIEKLYAKAQYALKGATELGSGYPSLVAEELGSENYTFINKGVGGDRILDVYARIVRDIIKIKPDVMSLLIGVNDIWHGFDWNNGTGLKRFEKIYNILIDELVEELPGTKLIILGAFVLEGSATANRPDQPERYSLFREGVSQVAAIERAAAERHGIKFVDLGKIFDEEAERYTAKALTGDGVHPTQKGHEIIKREWLKAFNELDI